MMEAWVLRRVEAEMTRFATPMTVHTRSSVTSTNILIDALACAIAEGKHRGHRSMRFTMVCENVAMPTHWCQRAPGEP